MSTIQPAEPVLCRYQYDALDRLAAATPLAEATVQRIYQKNRLSMEIQGAVHRRVMQFDDHVLAEQRATDTMLPATDLQRSVLHSIDAQGQRDIAYSPYGHRPSGSDVFSLLGFAGESPDPVTGHYPLGKGYRSYNPVLMRFNQPDSLSPFGEGGVNAYAYCQGDPVNRSDPTGHMSGPYALVTVSSSRRLSAELSPFESFPTLVHNRLFEYLPLRDIGRTRQTSLYMNELVEALPETVFLGRFKDYTIEQIKRTLERPKMDPLPRGVTSALKREVETRLQNNRDQFRGITAEIDNADAPRSVSVDTGRRARLIKEADTLEELMKGLRSGSESTLTDQHVRPGR